MAKTLIKWPGGKTGELEQILPYIPEFDRYIEPFFGGGAVYFALEPKKAVINDISRPLMEFYVLVREQDEEFYRLLMAYQDSFQNLQVIADLAYPVLYETYRQYMEGKYTEEEVEASVEAVVRMRMDAIMSGFPRKLVLSVERFQTQLNRMVTDKLIRTAKHEKKIPLSDEDRIANLVTGFTSGYYMYFRDVYNDLNLNRAGLQTTPYRIANYYFVREYCYGSMFRYNTKGEFNIPYGGISYNRKNFQVKIDNIFNQEMKRLFADTEIYCQDFETFLGNVSLTERDFMFLDPPYDTDFSDYEGKDFVKHDHERLAVALSETKAKFLMVIKNTEFIYRLYADNFRILRFDNQYSYNVKSRNERNAEHLIVTNIEEVK